MRDESGIATGTDKQKVLVDGDDVCVIYDLKAPPPSFHTCESYRACGGKVSSVSVVVDAHPFDPMFGTLQGH